MHKPLITLAASVVAAASFAGPAPSAKQGPEILPPAISYNNFSVNYSYVNGDAVSPFGSLGLEGQGISGDLEYSPIDHLYLAGHTAYHDLTVDVFGTELELDYWTAELGVGGYLPLTRNIDFVTEVGASYADLSIQNSRGLLVAGFSDTGWGLYVTPHLRAKWDGIEAHLGAMYNSNPMALTEWLGFLRVYVEVVPHTVDVFVGGTLALSNGNGLDDLWGLQAGARLKF